MNPTLAGTDGDLLAAFAQTGNQAAFAELVRRHGPMVQAVGVRVLNDHHAAEDLTQAVFVVLARKAESLQRDPSVAGWLYTVTRRLALTARQSRQSRQQREQIAMSQQPDPTTTTVDATAFRAELDDVLGQLPDRYRQPLVLFHLQSKSLDETGRLLGLNPNTLRTRLGRSRELLRKKLVARGVTVGSVGALTVLLSAESGAAVLPATFVAATVKAATGGAVSTTVAALSKGALHLSFLQNDH
jgi:RNA polymerase sigma factor (sigma-70 family)